ALSLASWRCESWSEAGNVPSGDQLDLRFDRAPPRVAAHLRLERNDWRVDRAGLGQCGWVSHRRLSRLSRILGEEETAGVTLILIAGQGRTRVAECAATDSREGGGRATRRWAPSRIFAAGGVDKWKAQEGPSRPRCRGWIRAASEQSNRRGGPLSPLRAPAHFGGSDGAGGVAGADRVPGVGTTTPGASGISSTSVTCVTK